MMQIEEINAIESEGGIVATLMQHPEFVVYDEDLQPRHFINKENRYIFAAIRKLNNVGVTNVDAYNIMEILDGDSEARYCSLTVDQINDIMSQSDILARATPEEYRMMSNKIKDAAFRRDTYQKLKECETYCFDRNVDDIEHKVYETLDSVIMDYNATSDLKEYKDVVDELTEKITRIHSGEYKPIEFPFERLNQYVLMEPGECICFAAPAKAGKSSILLTVLVYLLDKGYSVAYFDSEISSELFNKRLLAHLAKVPFGRIRTGTYGQAEAEQIEYWKNWLKGTKFIHYYMPTLDSDDLWLQAKKAKHMIDMDVIIVDYLKANSKDDMAYSVYASLGRVSDTLKNKIAGEMNVCAVTAAQTTNTGRIADSAKIARNVSTVITITEKTPDEIDPQNRYGTRKARVTYNRNGPQMTENEWIDMDFDGSLCKYAESENQHVELTPF